MNKPPEKCQTCGDHLQQKLWAGDGGQRIAPYPKTTTSVSTLEYMDFKYYTDIVLAKTVKRKRKNLRGFDIKNKGTSYHLGNFQS